MSSGGMKKAKLVRRAVELADREATPGRPSGPAYAAVLKGY